MQFLTKISDIFSRERKYQPLSLTDPDGWYRYFGINRRGATRILYNSDSAPTAYRYHELVFACINKIGDVMNDAEIVVERRNKENEWERVEGHPLAWMFKRPNPFQTGREVRKLMVQSSQSVGRFCMNIDRSAAGIPVQFSVLNPLRIETKWNATRDKVLYYEYLRNDGKRVQIRKEDLLICRRPDLFDQVNGFAPLEAALKSINSDLGMSDYIDAFFESDGTPSGILKILNTTLSDEKKRALQAQWKEKYGRGGSNQRGVAVLDQDADYTKVGSNLDELDSEALTARSESRICAVFGVPPNLVGAYVGLRHVTANATAKSELRNFWDNKISPELALLREWMTWFVLPEFEDIENIKAEKIRVGFDISQAAFLQEEVNDIHLRARDNFKAGGVTLNEFRLSIGLQPDPKGDYYLQPSLVTPISPENRAQVALEKVPQGKEPKEDETATGGNPDADDDPDKAIQQRINEKLFEAFGFKVRLDDSVPVGTILLEGIKTPPPEKKTFDLDGLTLAREPRGVETLISLKAIADDYDSERERATAILLKFRDQLIEQATEEIEKLDPATVHELTLAPDGKIAKQIRKALESAYRRGRAQIVAELQAQADAKGAGPVEAKDEFDDKVASFLDELANMTIAKIISEVQARAINVFVLLKMLLDYSTDKLRERLKDESTKFVEQTAGENVNAAIGSGRRSELQARADDIKHYEYSAILDVKTCGPCREADGEIAKDMADLPDAPNPACDGGAKCRCFVVGVIV